MLYTREADNRKKVISHDPPRRGMVLAPYQRDATTIAGAFVQCRFRRPSSLCPRNWGRGQTLNRVTGDWIMKLLTAAICLLSVGVLSGCVEDGGYRTGGYYSSGVYYRSYDRDRYYRDYDRRNWRHHREWRHRDHWRGDYRHGPRYRSGTQVYGVIVR